MEEAEHALFRAAGMSIAGRGSEIGWPRVGATFEFRSPLHFEDEFEVTVELAEATARRLRYSHTLKRADTLIGTGTITVACIRQAPGGPMQGIEVPADVVSRLREVLDR